MSFTPYAQRLSEPTKRAHNALSDLGARLDARLNHPEEWDKSHLKQCRKVRKTILKLQGQLAEIER